MEHKSSGYTITKNPKEILDEIVKIHGVGCIRDYMKAINKGTRKASPRVNNFQDVYYDVMEFMDNSNGYGFSYTRAITAVAEKRGLTESTVKTHCTKGKKQEAIKRQQKDEAKQEANKSTYLFLDENNLPF